MVDIARFKVDLSGFNGAPGVNTWFVADTGLSAGPSQGTVDGTAAALQAFYTAVAGNLQDDVTITVDPSVAVIRDSDGSLQNIITAAGGPYTATGTNGIVAPHFTMFKLQLRTGSFQDGREVRGGPYLGPVSSSSTQADGNIAPSTVTAMTAALGTLNGAINAAGGLLVVYRRPRSATGTLPSRAGTIAAVTAASMWSKPAVLRSRRD